MSRDEAIDVLVKVSDECAKIARNTTASWLKDQKDRMAEAARMGAEALKAEAENRPD